VQLLFLIIDWLLHDLILGRSQPCSLRFLYLPSIFFNIL